MKWVMDLCLWVVGGCAAFLILFGCAAIAYGLVLRWRFKRFLKRMIWEAEEERKRDCLDAARNAKYDP